MRESERERERERERESKVLVVGHMTLLFVVQVTFSNRINQMLDLFGGAIVLFLMC